MKRVNYGSHYNDIPSVGLTTVVDPENASLDVVFVHGFTGHPERTWAHKKGTPTQPAQTGDGSDPPPAKIKRTGFFGKSYHNECHTSVYWPRDLLPSTLPEARVLTYGYDTHISHRLGPPGNRNTVYDIAWDFLVALEAERRSEPSRPVLFVVHSLGGIVVKEMLRRSHGCYNTQKHLWSTFDATIGIMFFGTPHSGADPRGFLRQVAETVAKATGFYVNEQIVNALLPSSERLRELRDEWGPIAQQQQWTIHSFQEQHGIHGLNGRKVVEDVSSCLNIVSVETKEHIESNHMDMCRFTGLEDREYVKVAHALQRITEKIPNRSNTGPNFLDDAHKKVLLDSLRFDQIDARHMTIKAAHAKTCKWLLQTSQFKDWLDPTKLTEHHGFLWIKGKPGTGKSTLMKFAVSHAKRALKGRVIVSFFFHARGDDLEKSTLGFYRSILYQLLCRIPELKSVFDSLDIFPGTVGENHRWSIESLKALLEQALLCLGDRSFICFVDALDESDENQIRDMISFFEHIGESAVSGGVKFQICFSSRHYPHISIKKGLSLTLEGHEGHSQDIVNYVESELKIGRSDIAEKVRRDVEIKAAGVFMWVILVVDILNKEHDSGRVHTLRRVVQKIPGDLHELFRDILTRDSRNRGELVLCLQWILFSKRPMKPEELYFAIIAGVEAADLSTWDLLEIDSSDIQRFILDSSKGLAEITVSTAPKVQFIHESVNDFLLKENGLGRVWPDLETNFRGQSHEHLKKCCLNYINFDAVRYHLELCEDLPRASSEDDKAIRKQISEKLPFLEYAIQHILHHANIAEGLQIGQEDFIQNFQLSNWVRFDNLFETKQVRRHTESVSLLYILAEHDWANLIRHCSSVLSSLKPEDDERYGLPLFAALATKSDNVLAMFREAYADVARQDGSDSGYEQYHNTDVPTKGKRDFQFSKKKPILTQLLDLEIDTIPQVVFLKGFIEVDKKDHERRTPLWWAAARGYEAVVKLLLKTGQVDVESKDRYGQTPLMAATRGNKAVVKSLLETGQVNIDSKDSIGRTPLWWAADMGNVAVVKLLLETGQVDIDSKDNNGETPLSRAVNMGNVALVKLLLETGQVDINSKDKDGWTPLWWAANMRNIAVVKLLLETGQVDINSKDKDGWTPLSWAADMGNVAVVKLLLETGQVDINSKDKDGWTPLSWAANMGNVALVKLLLETSQVDIDSKDKDGRTPLSWAADEAVVKLLLETGQVDINSKDKDGRTPLWWAANYGNEAAVRLLLETGPVEIDSKDYGGLTPLDAAAGSSATVNLLLEWGATRSKIFRS